MEREDLKKTIQTMKQQFMNDGLSEEEAENFLANTFYEMAKDQKIGLYDAKMAMDILDLEPTGKMADTMEEFKIAILKKCQIGRYYPGSPNDEKHYKRNPVAKDGLFGEYQNGKLDELKFEMLMWATGWELSPDWFDLKDEDKKKRLILLED